MSTGKAIWVSHPTGNISGEFALPASKSESNRALIIQALTHGKSQITNLSVAQDTQLLKHLLASNAYELNAEDAGTAMRFFTAFAAVTNQQKILTGTPRMQQRPISLLVDALRELGADIEYLKLEGYPPLQINGIDLSWPAGEITVPGHVSSQFISALLLVAPVLPQVLRIRITGKIASRPYIDMTLDLMRHFGAKCYWNDNLLVCEPVPYSPAVYAIAADWSAAGYWYSVAALANKAEFFLPGIKPDSNQADSRVADFALNWGVKTKFTPQGALIVKTEKTAPQELEIDFTNYPDLAQTVLVMAAATGAKIKATGLESLKIKETDRIAALQTEVAKIGARLEENSDDWVLHPAEALPSELKLNTYQDHRMAMAFAPLGLLFPVEIQEPAVVKKSYPGFWDELGKAGFVISESA